MGNLRVITVSAALLGGRSLMTEHVPNPLDHAAAEQDIDLRRARERLDRIDEMRTADRLHQAGKTEQEIAEVLHTTQREVHRMLIAAELRGGEVSPEEVILRATADRTDREALAVTLSRMNYTFTVYAPEPFDGSDPGTWNQVLIAWGDSLLSDEEFERIQRAVNPPQHGAGS